ncbi:MAG: DUF4824 family protein [Nitrospiraceae bacterium]
MNWRRIALGTSLVVLTNAVALMGVAYNRSGEPDAEVTLTERELPLSYDSFRNTENTDISLRLNWHSPNHRWSGVPAQPREPIWFDQHKLEAIGYDCFVPLTDASADLYYGKQLPRDVYAVVEYDGPSWTAWLAAWERDQAALADQIAAGKQAARDGTDLKDARERLPLTASRLIVIDVGLDPARLRQQYPARNQIVILRAQVHLSILSESKAEDGTITPRHLQGDVTRLLLDDVHVPFEFRSVLENLPAPREAGRTSSDSTTWLPYEQTIPRYEVTLRFGQRHEPWITAIRPLPVSAK